jgi:hypothetical protein
MPLLVAVLGLALIAGACAKRMPGAPASDVAGAAPQSEAADGFAMGEPAGDLDTWEQELAHLRGELRAAGVVLDDDDKSVRDEAKRKVEQQHPMVPADADGDEAGRCQRICDLAEATCELQSRICALADDHTGEERYVAACTRADDDCRRASEACRGCSA